MRVKWPEWDTPFNDYFDIQLDKSRIYPRGWGMNFVAGKAELYIILALLIGMATVIVGCWLSDNCWSPEPEQHYTIAWHDRHRWI